MTGMDRRHILITGASSGIGAALAETYAANGIVLMLCGRDEARLSQIADTCRNNGAQVETALIDVTDAAAMQKQIEEWDFHTPLDLVIANAGVSGGLFGGTEDAAQTAKIFNVNVMGVLNTVSPVIPLMKRRKNGQIAIISSLAGIRGLPTAPAYSASKNAVRAWGEALRLNLQDYNVAVNVVCPGFIKTPLTRNNRFKMPLLMEPKAAAGLIKKGLDRNRARIVFPKRLYAGVRFLTLLPVFLSDIIVKNLPHK